MNWNKIALEKLENLYAALGAYLEIRRQKDAALKITELEKERQRVSLELFETQAQLSANQEMVGRLMSALKISPNGHNARPGPLPEKPSGPKPTAAAEDAPVGIALDEPTAAAEDTPVGIALDELHLLNIGEWGS